MRQEQIPPVRQTDKKRAGYRAINCPPSQSVCVKYEMCRLIRCVWELTNILDSKLQTKLVPWLKIRSEDDKRPRKVVQPLLSPTTKSDLALVQLVLQIEVQWCRSDISDSIATIISLTTTLRICQCSVVAYHHYSGAVFPQHCSFRSNLYAFKFNPEAASS